MKSQLLNDLKWRGLINDCTDFDTLDELLESEQLTLYCGFDPTGKSLHVGHLLAILTLRRFQEAGHKPLALVGGATGLIGDPSGKSVERQLNTLETVLGYVDSIKGQLSGLLDFNRDDNPAEIVNNYDWTHQLSVIEFLRDFGKNFGINYMLAKDTIASRLESGISYTEFSYTILQAMDFNHLYETKNCKLQIGGSDQWGNITSGLELIRKANGHEAKAIGFTMPLVTKADGTKFGKTAGGAIWLDPTLTSPYEMYQFFLNTADADVIKFLKYFTFLSKEEIEALETSLNDAPHLREAQKAVAKEVVTLVHGEDAYNKAIKITEALFKGNIEELNSEEIEEGFKDVPSTEVTEDINLIELLVELKAASSKRQAREFISNNSIAINGEKQNDLNFIVSKENAIEQKFTVIRRGKKRYFLVKHK